MKLAAIKIAAMDHGCEQHAIVAGGDCVVGHRREETVHIVSLLARNEASQEGIARSSRSHIVPAHMGHSEIRSVLEATHLALQETETFHIAFGGALIHELHAQAHSHT